MRRANAVERRTRVLEPPRVQVEQAQLEVAGEAPGPRSPLRARRRRWRRRSPQPHCHLAEARQFRRRRGPKRVGAPPEADRVLHPPLPVAEQRESPPRPAGARATSATTFSSTGTACTQSFPRASCSARYMRTSSDVRRELPCPPERRHRLRLVAERRVRRRQPQRRVEVVGVLGENLFEQRDDLRVLRLRRRGGRLLEGVEEPDHVHRTRRVLPDNGRGGGAHVAEAGERLPRVSSALIAAGARAASGDGTG